VSQQFEVIRLLTIFAKYPLYRLKRFDYFDLVKVNKIILNKDYLTNEKFNKLRLITVGMN